MKIKSMKFYTYLIYGMIMAYMLGPALSFKVGLPRIDNPFTILFGFGSLLIFLLDRYPIPKKIYLGFIALCALSVWPLIHLAISSLSPTNFMDIMFFMVLPGFFYLFYWTITHSDDPLQKIQKFLIFLVCFIAVPPFLELATGIQFVTASEELNIEAGSLKGLFFNPNNMATAAICTTPAILFFFLLEGRDHKEKWIGWVLIALLGMAILASVSRTAIALFFMALFVYVIYRKNGMITVIVTAAAVFGLSLIPDRAIKEFLLSLNGNQFLERFSSRVYLFMYDLGSDNSVSYRQEIYNYFWSNPPLLFAGYGPKNFKDYFGGHLSMPLGFENPHSFIIELYLGFGIISLLGFITYIILYCYTVVLKKRMPSKQKVIALLAMAIFLLAGFIPSTILRMPFIWLPCFLIFIYTVCVINKRNPLIMTTRE